MRLLPAGLRPVDVVRRRGRYGARLALVGGGRPAPSPRGRPPPRSPARSRARSAATRTAVERAARAAENLGVLLAPLVAHADLQPTMGSSPLRHTVPPPAPPPLRAAAGRVAGAARRRAAALERPGDPALPPRGGAPPRPARPRRPPRPLRRAPEVLAGRAAPLEQVAAGQAPPDAVAVTFDDGYADNLRHALPALQRAGVPATVFVATGHVASGAGFWWDTVLRLLCAAPASDRPPLAISLGDDTRAWPARTGAERERARRGIHGWLQARPPVQLAAALAQLGAWAHADPAATPDRDRPLTVAELRELAAAGPVTLGAHTRTHRSLAPVPARDAARGARPPRGDDLERWTGRRPAAASYPFGVRAWTWTPARSPRPPTPASARRVNAPGGGPAGAPLALPRLNRTGRRGDGVRRLARRRMGA
jgi:peptidoglycan/xylan/chitin deacetylase (PgdA/CDA1 family)